MLIMHINNFKEKLKLKDKNKEPLQFINRIVNLS